MLTLLRLPPFNRYWAGEWSPLRSRLHGEEYAKSMPVASPASYVAGQRS